MIGQEYYTILLKQHIGASAEPVVSVGDRVNKGKLIARIPKGSLGTPIHASVNGIIERITEAAIVVKADEEQETGYEQLSGESIQQLVEQAGIAGMGGAGFPTYVKLKNKLSAQGCVIVNAAECEPIFKSQY